MKVKLPIPERIRLGELLADEEGKIARLEMILKFRMSLSLSEEEQKLVGYSEFRTPQGSTMSSIEHPEKDPNKEFDIGEILTEMIWNKLQRLESGQSEQRLNQNQIKLYRLIEAGVAEEDKAKSK